jgi:hypothetical protein
MIWQASPTRSGSRPCRARRPAVLQESAEKRVFTEINLCHVRIRHNHIKTVGIQRSGYLLRATHNDLGQNRTKQAKH